MREGKAFDIASKVASKRKAALRNSLPKSAIAPKQVGVATANQYCFDAKVVLNFIEIHVPQNLIFY